MGERDVDGAVDIRDYVWRIEGDKRMIRSVTAERGTGHEARERRFLEWYGWKPWGERGATCPLRIVGKRCRRWDARDIVGCICEHRTGLIDHPAMWKGEDGEVIWTSEPYHLDTEEFFKFAQDLAGIGMAVEVKAGSGWYPGKTILVVVTRDGDD